jgi:hypothetical protein
VLLWDQYEKEIVGYKVAKDFTSAERLKTIICMDTIKEMVLRGWNVKAACSEIYNVYGQSLSVTKIIDQLRKGSNRSLMLYYL